MATPNIPIPQTDFINPQTGMIDDVWWRYLRDPVFNSIVTVSTIPVSSGGTGLSSGVSGGIPGFISGSSMSSSALLTQYAIVLGGGAGAVPSSLTTTGASTQVLHGNSSIPFYGPVILTADVTGILPIANGGTNASTAATARSSLGLGPTDNVTFDTVTTVTATQLGTSATHSLNIYASTISYQQNTTHLSSHNFQGFVRANLNVTTNPQVTSSGVQIWVTGNVPVASLINSTHVANNRVADWIYTGGILSGRFTNDANSLASNWINVTGGQASGITLVAIPSGTVSIGGALNASSAFNAFSTATVAKAFIGSSTGSFGNNLFVQGLVKGSSSAAVSPSSTSSGVQIYSTGSTPIVSLMNTSRAANSRQSTLYIDAAGFNGAMTDDASTSSSNWITVSGNNTVITSMTFYASTVNWNNPSHNSTHTFLSTVAFQGILNANGSANLGSSATFGLQVNATTVGWNNPTHNSSHTFASTVTFNGLTAGNVSSGVYTPTLSSIANLDGATTYQAQFIRIGPTVNVSGKVDIDPTLTATLTKLGISLPIASNIGAEEDVAGTAFASGIASQGAAILGNATDDTAQMTWISSDITVQPMYYVFSYQVI